MAAQGFAPKDFIWSEQDYSLYCFLGGNAMTTSVAGACLLALVLCVFLNMDPPPHLRLVKVWSGAVDC